ncbi:MAG: hypothetical protein AAGA38_04335 [Pseudomonadota bacterium]
MRDLRSPLRPVLILLLAGCSPPEELVSAASPEALEADAPEIAPLTGLLQPRETRLSEQDAEDLLSRAEANEARAARLR